MISMIVMFAYPFYSALLEPLLEYSLVGHKSLFFWHQLANRLDT